MLILITITTSKRAISLVLLVLGAILLALVMMPTLKSKRQEDFQSEE